MIGLGVFFCADRRLSDIVSRLESRVRQKVVFESRLSQIMPLPTVAGAHQ